MMRRMWRWCLRIRMSTWLRAASVLTLVALALMVWSLFDPTLIPIIVGMSLAQVFGTIAFAIYLVVVVLDQTRQRRGKQRMRRFSQQALGDPE